MPVKEYLAKLRLHLLKLVKHPKKPLDLVRLTCDSCNESWVMPKEEASKIVECPFCHHSTNH